MNDCNCKSELPSAHDRMCPEYKNLPKATSECPPDLGCSAAEQRLVEIYETQAIEAAMFLMAKLNRGQIKRIRGANPNMADFYAECLSR